MPNFFSVAFIKHKTVVAWRDFLQGGIDESSCMETRA